MPVTPWSRTASTTGTPKGEWREFQEVVGPRELEALTAGSTVASRITGRGQDLAIFDLPVDRAMHSSAMATLKSSVDRLSWTAASRWAGVFAVSGLGDASAVSATAKAIVLAIPSGS